MPLHPPVYRKSCAEFVNKVIYRYLLEYRNNGILPYYQLGGKILYKESDVEKLLEDNYCKAFQE